LIAARRARSERGGELLGAFSYRGVLARGFALARDAAGQPLRSIVAVTPGMPMEIELADGRIGARAEGAASPRPPVVVPARSRGRRGGEGQGSLF
jgi:exodeoxyribonuclease VII large subunit